MANEIENEDFGARPRKNSISSAVKGARFWGSLTKTAMRGYVGKNLGICNDYHWNFIRDRLILGALPIRSKVGSSGDHLSKLQKQLNDRNLTLGLVVSIVEQSEFEGYGLNMVEFVKHEDWRSRLGVQRFLHLDVADFTANFTIQQLENAANQIRETIHDRQQAVYVHCKGGKGRSWLIVVCYLVAHEDLDLDMACALVKLKRPQVSPSSSQQKLARCFYNYIRGLPLESARSRQTSIGRSPSVSEPEERDGETRYFDILAQALELPLEDRIRLVEDLTKTI
eukprot:NODE_5128_length_1063_cov_43.730851_g4572_i0.p1 GENE.NODE_5128_length_1063_cov_43.730851_g4572_i0~~NODE_5128_length_1063_cov_43.730851_g4572_i0.p1  ORF type:complete len:282 (-),score=47.07 NODE_5128_length_1063_cov_43.730851_g4572_i0:110-955(-)